MSGPVSGRAAAYLDRLCRLGRGRFWLAACVGAVAAVHAARILRGGVVLSSDSVTYARWADDLIAAGFNPFTFLDQTTFVFSPIVYLLWIALIAACKVVLGSQWATGIVALNWIAVCVVATLILRTVRAMTRCGAAMMLAAALLLGAFEILLFSAYALSDVTFLALATGVLVSGVGLLTAPRHQRRRLVMIGTLLVAIALVYRPTAPPLVAYWIAAVWIGRVPPPSRRMLAMAASLAVAGLAAGVAIHAALMANPARWPFRSGAAYVERLSQEHRTGAVVQHRPETYVSPPQTYLDFVALTARKWTYYFAPTVTGFGLAHTAMNLLLFGSTYLLTAAALVRWPDRRAVWLLVWYIVVFSAFHAVQKVDFDFRYRLPVIPALIVAAALGAAGRPWDGDASRTV